MNISKIFLLLLVCVCAHTSNAQIITTPPITPTTITKISPVSVGTTGDVTIGSRTTTRICTGESYENINFSDIKIYTTVDVGNRVATLTGLSNKKAYLGVSNNIIRKIYAENVYTSSGTCGVLSASDARLKINVRPLKFEFDKILKLRPVTYDFFKDASGDTVVYDPAYQNRVGFIAQEVQEIFPNLVELGTDTIYRMDYAGLIPYLTQVIQEQYELNQQQSEEIKKLQQQLHDIQFMSEGNINKAPDATTEEATEVAVQSLHQLYQNTPNPFNTLTTIKYRLNEDVINAKICIYNLTGKQLQCYALPVSKGEQAIEIQASSLQAGMYLYSLIVGDKLIATKRMILTEN